MARPLTLSLGEILWDILPSGKTLGGAITNAAWHLTQLGADARIASAVGDDPLGREIIQTLLDTGFDPQIVREGIPVLPGVPTSTVDAVLGADGSATYTIHENVAWDRLPVTPALLDVAARADAINIGSLSLRSPEARKTTHACLDAARPEAVLLFDINLRPPHYAAETLKPALERVNAVKMNHDELPVLAGMHGWPAAPEAAMAALMERYPNVRNLIVTRAADGAWWRTRDRLVSRPAGTIDTLVDTIGAGDSVTAVCIMGILLGRDPGDTLESAQAIAAFVCSRRGGTPALPESLLRSWR